ELIAALVQAMLRSGNPLSYTIPGSWEHFKNFRYRRLLNNADVPSVLIEFCRASLSEEVAYDMTTWLTGGLISYFRKPLAEEVLFKLQSLLQRLREACHFAEGKSRQEDEKAPVVLSAAVLEEPRTRVSGTGTTGDVPVPGSDDRLAMTVAAFAEHSPTGEDKGVKATEDASVPSREGDNMTGSGGATNAMVAEVIQEFAVPAKKEILTEDAQGSVPDQAGSPVSSPPPPAKAPLPGAGSPGGGQPAQSIPVTGDSNQAPGPASPVKTLDGGTARRWHWSNPFAPPGGGPVFIFKRPLEATLAPSIFPQEVLERMAPLPLYSTFLGAGKPWHYHPSVPLADKARVGPDIGPVSRPEVLKQPPHDPATIRTVTIRTDSENPVTGPDDGPLAELKNLSAAILAPEQQREPLNGEAPSN
ncbi:MAG: hypothetical protein H5T99_00610, partial [Moorella sp. (in: Bacteria)]|nr:hypothetical protein [Moorella sp. (in: firmicutes)]